MIGKLCVFILVGTFSSSVALAQTPVIQPAVDTTPVKQSSVDTSFTDYDVLFNELDALIDSLTAPRNFTLINLGVGSNYFNYESKSTALLEAKKRITYSPTLGFFSKSGLGISGSSVIVQDGKQVNPYLFYVTGSYDYIRNKRFMTGVSMTRFITKDSLPFYTSPLKNEAYAYFTYRKLWVRPTVAVSYGWGSRTDFIQREDYITSLQLALNGYTKINQRESINDLNVTVSVRHDFYYMDLFTHNDYIRLTPQFAFTSGTQKFGFNQTSNSYATIPKAGTDILYYSDNVYLDNKMDFQPLTLTGSFKGEYSKGKFFVQPQFMLGYYFPAVQDNFTTALILSAGLIF